VFTTQYPSDSHTRGCGWLQPRCIDGIGIIRLHGECALHGAVLTDVTSEALALSSGVVAETAVGARGVLLVAIRRGHGGGVLLVGCSEGSRNDGASGSLGNLLTISRVHDHTHNGTCAGDRRGAILRDEVRDKGCNITLGAVGEVHLQRHLCCSVSESSVALLMGGERTASQGGSVACHDNTVEHTVGEGLQGILEELSVLITSEVGADGESGGAKGVQQGGVVLSVSPLKVHGGGCRGSGSSRGVVHADLLHLRRAGRPTAVADVVCEGIVSTGAITERAVRAKEARVADACLVLVSVPEVVVEGLRHTAHGVDAVLVVLQAEVTADVDASVGLGNVRSSSNITEGEALSVAGAVVGARGALARRPSEAIEAAAHATSTVTGSLPGALSVKVTLVG